MNIINDMVTTSTVYQSKKTHFTMVTTGISPDARLARASPWAQRCFVGVNGQNQKYIQLFPYMVTIVTIVAIVTLL